MMRIWFKVQKGVTVMETINGIFFVGWVVFFAVGYVSNRIIFLLPALVCFGANSYLYCQKVTDPLWSQVVVFCVMLVFIIRMIFYLKALKAKTKFCSEGSRS